MHKKPLEVLIFGTGAVGATFGWRASLNSNVRLTTVCRSNFEAVKRSGLLMRTKTTGDVVFKPHRVVRNTEDVCDVEFDYVVCANKITDSSGNSFINNLDPIVRPHTTLVSTQNGFAADPILRRAFPKNIVLSGICYISCAQRIPGIIEHIGQIRPWAFGIGLYKNHDDELAKERLQRLIDLDSQFGYTEKMDIERWKKLIFNGSWNPVAAIYQMTTQEIYRNPTAWLHVQSLAEEIYSVAVASGMSLPADTSFQTLNYVRNLPPIVLSTLQDLRAGKPLEVEPLCGSVLRQADHLGLSVPAIRTTYNLLTNINRRIISPPVQPAEPTPELHEYLSVGWSIASSA